MVEIFKIKILAFWCILKWPAWWGGRLASGIHYLIAKVCYTIFYSLRSTIVITLRSLNIYISLFINPP